MPDTFAAELDIQEATYDRLEGMKIRVRSFALSVLLLLARLFTVPIKMLASNEAISCRTYIYQVPSRKYAPPSPHYKHVIVSGAIEHELPAAYIEKLQAIPHNGRRPKQWVK